MLHRVLNRQLRRLGLDQANPPDHPGTWADFLQKISSSYEDADRSRYLLERSLQVSSTEMLGLYEDARSAYSTRISRSEEHYRSLFDQTPIPTWEEDFSHVEEYLHALREEGVVDLEEHIHNNPAVLEDAIQMIVVTDVNPAAMELVKATDEDQLLGNLDPRLITAESFPSWLAQVKAVWDSASSVKFQLRGTRLDGMSFDGILQWHAPLIEGSYDYTRVLVTIVDITEQTEAERQIRQVLKSKDEFLASISHELRTPLTSVLGFAQVLRDMDEKDNDDERGSLLGIIADQATDLSDIVEDLLVAARSELGQLTVVGVPVDIHAQIAQVSESRSLTDGRMHLPPRDESRVVALGDPQRVRQIMRNLITNATRYGGPEVRVVFDAGSDFVRVSVQDNGAGLGPEESEKIFDRYYRNHDHEGQPGSVGIGLTISRELARMMGGDLAYRRLEGWTSFDLTLPKAEDGARTHAIASGSVTDE